MTGVEIQFSVKNIPLPPRWYEVPGIPFAARVVAYQALGASSQESSYVNLILPGTFDLTPNPAPAWDTAIGWTFTGSEILDTEMTQDFEYSIFVRYANLAINPTSVVMGTEISLVAHIIGSDLEVVPANAAYEYFYNSEEPVKLMPGVNITGGVIALYNNIDTNTYGLVIDDFGGELNEMLIAGSLTSKIPSEQYTWGGNKEGSGIDIGFHGDILAAIVYNTPLTNIQREAVIGALQGIT